MIDARELGSRLRIARESAELSHSDVAIKIGLSKSAVEELELGNRAVSSLELDRLAYLFGRNIRDFFAESFSKYETHKSGVCFCKNPSIAVNDDPVDRMRKCIALEYELTNLEEILGINDANRSMRVLILLANDAHRLGLISTRKFRELTKLMKRQPS